MQLDSDVKLKSPLSSIGLLSLEEINLLAVIFDESERVSLTDLLDKKIGIKESEAEESKEEVAASENIVQLRPGATEQIAVKQVVNGPSISLAPANASQVITEADGLTRIEEKMFDGEVTEESLLNKLDKFLDEEEEIVKIEDDADKIDRNVFILDVQRKLRKTRLKMRERQLLGEYKKNSSKDIETDKSSDDEGISESSSSGILIDKKQF